MSIAESAESAAPPKLSARQHLIKFLRDKLAFVSEDASTAELIRQARAFGRSEILSDGSRMPALDLRPLFEEYQRQTS